MTKENKTNLSIIIVNYNTKTLAKECIESVLNTVENINFEIILVDNSTLQNEVLRISHNKIKTFYIENKGYANANNFGVKRATGEYILLLNPDTIVNQETINKCYDFFNNDNDMGALSCKILLPSGVLDHACRRGFPTPFNSFAYYLKLHKLFKGNPVFCQYTYSHLDENKSYEVDSISGAFMMMKKDLYVNLHGLDERFFMYAEDIDLCFRIKEKGLKVYYYADYSIIHKKHQSGLAKKSKFVIKAFYVSMILFYNKHYRKKYNPLTTFIVISGITIIMHAKLTANAILKTLNEFSKK